MDGSALIKNEPKVAVDLLKEGVKESDLALNRKGMWMAVNEGGTASAVKLPDIQIAGKTGTAQVGYVARPGDDPKWAWFYARDDAWFAALYPAQAPELALVVLVEHGASGPAVAAPIAFDILRSYAQLSAKRKGSVR